MLSWRGAVQAGSYYWVGDGIVGAVPVGGGAVTRLASVGSISTDLAGVDASNAYVWTPDSLWAVPLAGGSATLVQAFATGSFVFRATLEGSYLYWTQWYSPFAVMRVPAGGGNAEVLAFGEMDPSGIDVDAKAVYWADQQYGMRALAK
jgi:hypothetical protein